MLQAICVEFYHYCVSNDIRLEKKNFQMSYDTNIPRQLGLAGSSAIITAGMSFQYHVLKGLDCYLMLSSCLMSLAITCRFIMSPSILWRQVSNSCVTKAWNYPESRDHSRHNCWITGSSYTGMLRHNLGP